ncbi:APC family permease [Paenibacillus vini]|uniref:APC family permease n=1 Tax=Paenibacillus vini TaxID=1476024 RepID=UPI0025B6BA48|nr:APC family permease [Paenibacillus vini]MDN4070903.1 APC family permease [Paenibacillus vini]
MKTPWIVIALGVFLAIAAIFRLAGHEIPSLAVASFSVVAVFTSVADLIEVLRWRRIFQTVSLFLAMVFFIVAFSVWVFPPKLDPTVAQYIGDAFTILGIAAVIAIFGIKELKTSTALTSLNDKEVEFLMTKREFEEMMNLNDIIENLKVITDDTFPYNRVHNGWALFYDSLSEHWNRWKAPFYDGINRQMFFDFIKKLDRATEEISNIADTDPRRYRECKIKMWNENLLVTIQPAISNPHVPTIKQVNTYLVDAMNTWGNLKKQISERYEQSRAKQ